jgi:CitMHS family citrate-Mg2+:H+ or citrate-Ca2+:H+ symporter
METVVGFIMLAIIVFLLVSNKTSIIPVFGILPILAAMALGYGIKDIQKFMNDGFGSVLNTVVLFAFAVMYFSILSEVGMFDVIVNKVMRYLGNSVLAVLYVASFVTIISHLDGSGATTALVTIPTMLPIFKKMKMRPICVVFVMSIMSGAMNITPWCASMLRVTSVTGLDAQELWRYLAPIQAFAIIMGLLFMIPIAALEKKNGAGMSDAEFAELKASISKPAEVKVSTPILAIDMIMTLFMIVGLLLGWFGTAIGFIVAFGLALVLNFRTVKSQREVIRKYGGPAINMVMTIIAIGVLVGVMNGTGMIKGMTNAILAVLPDSLGRHLCFLVSLFIVPINTVIGSDNVYFALTPIMQNIVSTYGVSNMALATSIVVPCALAANVTLIGASPYLALGLADCTMGEQLKYTFKWIWLLGILSTLFGVIIGRIPL